MDFLRCLCSGFCLLHSCISRRCFNTLVSTAAKLCPAGFDFYLLILHLYHQISHMAELCHINIKRRFRRHIFFSDKILQKIFCLCHNTTEQYQYHSQILNKSQCYHHCPVCPASQPTKWILSMDIHSCHIRLIIPLNHTQKFPSISFVKTCMVCNQINRSNSFGLHILHNNIK